MRFDTVIIGGGLAGLTAGILLAQQGVKCAIISSGQSALHFFSGSLDLLGRIGDEDILQPIDAVDRLNENHPYRKISKERLREYAAKVVPQFEQIGLHFVGCHNRNHHRVSPIGEIANTWLTLDNHYRFEIGDDLPKGKTLVVNIEGFLDFYPHYIVDGLRKKGKECDMSSVTISELQALRTSPTEMRSANIAKTLQNEEALNKFIDAVNKLSKGYDTVILPSVFGLYDTEAENIMRERIQPDLQLMATFPPSVPGIRMQIMMKKYFQSLGGVYMLGDTVTSGNLSGNKVVSVQTYNHKDIQFSADTFIVASGSFFSHGLKAYPNSVIEPIFNLDVTESGKRTEWFDRNIFSEQAYMTFGVKTNSEFKPSVGGAVLENMYVIGSILESANSLKEASGAGIAILSAYHVVNQILNTCSHG